jgi:DUF1009 family protein
MEGRLGIIAGSGDFPFYVCEEAQNLGYSCVVAGIRGEAESSLGKKVSVFEWFDVSEITKVVAFFRKNGVREAVFSGKIDHRIIYQGNEQGKMLSELLEDGRERSPTVLIQAVIKIFSVQGINIQDPTKYIASAFCAPGVLTETKPSKEVEEDILYAWELARKLADLDIGQTVVVKHKAVVALEGMEGTDETIKRGAELAGKGIVVVKVSRSSQDPRIDLPAIGLETVKNLVHSGGAALAFEAERIPFFQREEALSLAEAHRVSIIAKKDV